MGSSDWTCEPRQHDFTEVTMRVEVDGKWEPHRLYCKRCGWVRDIDHGSVELGWAS